MAADSVAALRESIRARAFERVYYLFGDEEYRKAQVVRELILGASDLATRAFNLDVRSAAELDAETVESLLGTPPLMAERRVVVISDVAALKKGARAALNRYLARPAEDILLVLIDAGGEKATPDRELQRLTRSVSFVLLEGEDLRDWISEHLTELGTTITPGAIELLESAVGSDLPALAAELDKLLSYTRQGEIDDTAVSAVVGVQRGQMLGAFLDFVGQRDAARALALLPHILRQPRTTGVGIVMALTTQTLALAWGLAMRDRGLRADYFDLLKGTKAFPFRPWKEAATAWGEATGKWSDDDLDGAARALLQADIALKESRVSSDEQILASLTLALCAGNSVSEHRT